MNLDCLPKEVEATDEELEQITELASRLMSIRDIAVIMEVDEMLLAEHIKDVRYPIGKAYNRGYLQTKAQIRKSVVDLAIAGSSPAQTLALKFIAESEFDKT